MKEKCNETCKSEGKNKEKKLTGTDDGLYRSINNFTVWSRKKQIKMY